MSEGIIGIQNEKLSKSECDYQIHFYYQVILYMAVDKGLYLRHCHISMETKLNCNLLCTVCESTVE